MWEQIQSNKRKTIFFTLLMTILFVVLMGAVGLYVFGSITYGLIMGLVVWIFICLFTYFKGDSMFLSSSNAHKINPEDAPVLYDVVEEMRIAAGLPKTPDIYIIDEDAPNAFATGRSPEKASIAVTKGLLVRLNRQELQGVIAHETAHIANSDILVMLFTGTILGSIVLMADIFGRARFNSRSSRGSGGNAIILLIILLFIVLSPLLAQLLYFAVSRKREYLADACAAQFTRYPLGLANALMKISSNTIKMDSANSVTAAMYIVNPLNFDKVTKKLSDLSSTHPSTMSRIQILTKMANVDFASYEQTFKEVTGKSSPVTSKMHLNINPAGMTMAAVAPEAVSEATQTIAPISNSMPIEDTPEEKIQKYRDTENLMWKYSDYIFVNCDCGTKLKIPQEYYCRQIKCPHCGKYHTVS